MANNVLFRQGTRAQYDALQVKDANTIYWLEDTLELYKGEQLYGTGSIATSMAAGLMSAADKKKLDELSAGGIAGLSAVDASIILGTDENGVTIGVQVSNEGGNAVELKDDGLFVKIPDAPANVEYSIEEQDVATDGFVKTYRMKRTDGDTVTYVGDEINIPKDAVLKGGTFEVVDVAGQPYSDAEVGDPYVDLVIDDKDSTHIYIPMKDLVDTVNAGDGVSVINNTVSIKIDDANANGLSVGEDGLSMAVATKTSAGAMSAEDKAFLSSVPDVYGAVKYEATNMLPGARFDVNGREIRVMFPSDAAFTKPTGSAAGRDPNCYYFGLRVYAPSRDVTGFKESLSEYITNEPMEDFNGASSGIDKYGRKYDVCWFPAARYDDQSGTWTYYGASSEEGKYVGWYHTIEWYNGEDCVASETIRINLTNEDCHNSLKQFLGSNNTTGALVWEKM